MMKHLQPKNLALLGILMSLGLFLMPESSYAIADMIVSFMNDGRVKSIAKLFFGLWGAFLIIDAVSDFFKGGSEGGGPIKKGIGGVILIVIGFKWGDIISTFM